MSISEKIQQLRKSSGLSQEQFAEKLDVSRQAISKWETGISFPDVEKLVLISELFDVSTDYLLKDENTVDCGVDVQYCIQVPQKLYVVDINKKWLSAFDKFEVEMFRNNGEADLIAGIGKPATKVKVPACILYGVENGVLGLKKRTILGYYASLEDAEKELNNISKGGTAKGVYELKYPAKLEGVRIVEND